MKTFDLGPQKFVGEVANVAQLLFGENAVFVAGFTFLMDGGIAANYYHGHLKVKDQISSNKKAM